jgi:hypothetical protein
MSMKAGSPVDHTNDATYEALTKQYDSLLKEVSDKHRQLQALASRMKALRPAEATLRDYTFSSQEGDPRVAAAAAQLQNPNGAPAAASLSDREQLENALKAAVQAKGDAETRLLELQSDLSFLKKIYLGSYLTQRQFESIRQYGMKPLPVQIGNVVVVKLLGAPPDSQYQVYRYQGPSREYPKTETSFSKCDEMGCEACSMTRIANHSIEIFNIDQKLHPYVSRSSVWDDMAGMIMGDPVPVRRLPQAPDLSFLAQKKLGDHLTIAEFNMARQHAKDSTPLQKGDIILAPQDIKTELPYQLMRIRTVEKSMGTIFCDFKENELSGYCFKSNEVIKINKTFCPLFAEQLAQNPPRPFRVAANAEANPAAAAPAAPGAPPAAAGAKAASAAGAAGAGAAASANANALAAAGAGALKVEMNFLALPLESELTHEQFQLFLTHGCESDKRPPDYNERVVVRRDILGRIKYQLLEYFGPGITHQEGQTTVFSTGKGFKTLINRYIQMFKIKKGLPGGPAAVKQAAAPASQADLKAAAEGRVAAAEPLIKAKDLEWEYNLQTPAGARTSAAESFMDGFRDLVNRSRLAIAAGDKPEIEYLIMNGNITNVYPGIKNRSVISMGSSPDRELIAYQPFNSPKLDEHFNKLKAELEFEIKFNSSFSTERKVRIIKDYILQKVFFRRRESETLVTQAFGKAKTLGYPTTPYQIPGGKAILIPVIPLDHFIGIEAGVCRQHALLFWIFVKRLCDEPNPILNGIVHVMRDNLPYGAHAWALFIPKRVQEIDPAEIWSVDPLNDLVYNLCNEIQREALERYFSKNVVARMVERTKTSQAAMHTVKKPG